MRLTPTQKARVLIAIVIGLSLGAGSTRAATIVNDSFTDGGFTDGADTRDVSWSPEDNSVTLSIDAGNQIDGNTLKFDSTSNNRSVVAYFSTITLAATGDWVTLTFDTRYPDGPDKNYGFGFGLASSNGTAASGGEAGNLGDDGGFTAAINPGAAASNGGKFAEINGDTNLGKFDANDPAGGAQRLSLKLERANHGELKMTLTGDLVNETGQSVTKTATAPNTYAFDEVIFSLSGGGNRGPFYLDNVQVDTNVTIPEPASLALLSVGVVGLISRRRRGRG